MSNKKAQRSAGNIQLQEAQAKLTEKITLQPGVDNDEILIIQGL